MENTYLKKEFKDGSELQRLRNIIKKNFGDNTKIQKGYEKEFVERKEGDVWEENNKKWTIKNGITMSYTPTQQIRQETQLPLFCPKCGDVIKSNYDKKMFKLYSHCFTCQLKIETQMKLDGTFEEFEKNIIKANITDMVREVESDVREFMSENQDLEILTANGDKEEWSGEIVKENFVKDVNEMTEAIKRNFEFLDDNER